MGKGAAQLVQQPYQQYKRDGRQGVLRGLRKGVDAFVRSVTLEALGLGAHVAGGAHTVLESALHRGGGGGSGDGGGAGRAGAAGASSRESAGGGGGGGDSSRDGRQSLGYREPPADARQVCVCVCVCVCLPAPLPALSQTSAARTAHVSLSAPGDGEELRC